MDLDDGRERLRPGRPRPGGVEALEVYERRGDGHTLSRHCATPAEAELERLRRHPALRATGSFPDAATAQRCVEACVAAHREQVDGWRHGDRRRLVINHDMGEVIGDVLERTRVAAGHVDPLPTTDVRVVLRADDHYRSGYAVLTAYPVRRHTDTYPQ